ncbi:MAG TPA: Hpt domain-containing protein [Xanthomonadaceae bacterium]|nr:Hpt domain-containing protein [Xanthomonadaceae bacterium]
MRLQEDIDFTTLSWVKAELDATFKQARQALEAYVEDPEDTGQMRFCANYLHQVQGTLRMVELYGAAMAVEEMEKVALAILDNKVANRDDSYGVLMRGMLQLPDYLERLQSGHKDIPVVLLPLLNDLRGVIGEQQLGEQVLFSPDLSLPLPADVAGPARPAPVLELGLIAERLRTGFQQALLKWFKGDQPEHALHRMGAIVERLAELTYEEPARKLWWVCAGLIDALSKESTRPDSSLKLLFGKIEREIKRLATAGEISFRVEPPRELTRSLLYQIATHAGSSPRVEAIRAAFHLAELLPSSQEVEHAVGSISGHNRALLDTVSSAIKEDLLRVKEALDLHLRSPGATAGALEPNLEILERVADTLGMLGLAVARRVVAEQREALGDIVTGGREADEGALLDIAGALLYVEGTLDDQVEMLGSQGPESEQQVMPQAEGRRVVEAVAREAGFNLQKVKDDYVAFIESPWDHERLRSVAPQLEQVSGALRILDQEEAARLVIGLARFTEIELLSGHRVPTAEQMDRVADALASIEYYLEATREHRGGRDRILEVARESLAWLGYWPLSDELLRASPVERVEPPVEARAPAPARPIAEPVPAPTPVAAVPEPAQPVPGELIEAAAESAPVPAPEQPAAPIESSAMGFQVVPSDDIDDEIREVFIEEVQEEIDSLNALFPEWRENLEDVERLKPIRRSFHTLKGSGRLVGARALGEFSWKVENMLNRVLDKTIEPGDAVLALIERALALLPSMLSALEGKGVPGPEIAEVMDVADRLAAGEEAWVQAALAEPRVEVPATPPAVEAVSVEPEVAAEEPSVPFDAGLEEIEMASDVVEVELPTDAVAETAPISEEELPGFSAMETAGEVEIAETAEAETIPATSLYEEPPTVELETPAGAATEAGGQELPPVELEKDLISAGEVGEPEEIEVRAPERDTFRFAEVTVSTDELTETDRLIAEMAERFAEEEAQRATPSAIDEPAAEPVVEPDELREYVAEAEQPQHEEAESAMAASAAVEEVDETVFETPIAIDPVLFDILRSEVGGHLEVMTDYLNACREAGEPVPASEALQRATHTMNGAFAMVDVPMIGAVVSPLEGYVKRLRAADRVPDERGIEALADSVTLISAVMMSVEYNEPMPDTRPLAAVLRQLRDELPAPQTPHGLLTPFEDIDTDFLGEIPDEPIHAVTLPPADLPLPDIADSGTVEARITGTDAERAAAAGETAEAPKEAETEEAPEVAVGRVPAEAESSSDVGDAGTGRAEEITLELPVIEPGTELEMLGEEFAAEVEATAGEMESFLAEAGEAVEDQAAVEELGAEEYGVTMVEPADEAESTEEVGFEGQAADEEIVLEEISAFPAEAELETEEEAERTVLESTDEGAAGVVEEELEWLAEPAIETDAEHYAEAEAEAEVEAMPTAATSPAYAASVGLELAPGEPEGLPPLADPADPEGALDLPDLDADLLEVFVQEAGEILDNADRLMASLRESPNERDIVVGLQRELHTLKGGARMAGLNPIGDLGHAMESLFEAVAEGKRRLGRVSIETLESAFDRLHAQVTRVSEGRAISLATATLERLEGLVRGDLVGPAAAPAESAVAVEAAQLPRFVPVAAVVEEEDEGAPRVQAQEYIRVRAELLDSLVNYAGEVAIYRGRLEQQVGAFRFNLVELEQTVDRLRDQLRKLEIETEAQILSRYQREAESEETFDPLELDRFSNLQQLSRALAESVSDLMSLQNILDDNTRQSETLLLQQSRVSSDLQEGLMRTRMVPFESLVPRLRRLVRQTASELGRKAQLKVEGAQGEMDRNVLERMIPPLEHMLRNSLAHGIEAPAERVAAGKPEEGTIRIRIGRESTEVVIHVADDGKGIDRDAIRRKAMERGLLKEDAKLSDRDLFGFILESGFSTATEVSQIAGRGVGMDVVASEIKQLGGSLHIESERGSGTDIVVRLPFTLAVTQAVLVKMGDTSFAVPISSVQGVARISHDELEKRVAEGKPTITYGGEEYLIHDLSAMLDLPVSRAVEEPQLPLLLSRTGDQRSAVRVDAVLGSKEIVVKPVGPQISSVPGIFGATIMGDGSVVVILDMAPLVRRASALRETMEAALTPIARAPAEEVVRQRVVMVVDDSITMRKVTGRTLERNDYEVMTAKDGLDAVEKLQDRIPDVMLLDIEMPRMDGYELATYMRNDPRLRNIPIIMITSRTGEKHRQRAFEIGVDRYLGKPYQEAELLRNVEEMMQEGRA